MDGSGGEATQRKEKIFLYNFKLSSLPTRSPLIQTSFDDHCGVSYNVWRLFVYPFCMWPAMFRQWHVFVIIFFASVHYKMNSRRSEKARLARELRGKATALRNPAPAVERKSLPEGGVWPDWAILRGRHEGTVIINEIRGTCVKQHYQGLK